jgi:hypothetical protein
VKKEYGTNAKEKGKRRHWNRGQAAGSLAGISLAGDRGEGRVPIEGFGEYCWRETGIRRSDLEF